MIPYVTIPQILITGVLVVLIPKMKVLGRSVVYCSLRMQYLFALMQSKILNGDKHLINKTFQATLLAHNEEVVCGRLPPDVHFIVSMCLPRPIAR